ncbi:ABC-type antimicrobial peptide transport system permease subunit [Catenulispora sp. GAS73]
MARRRGDLAVTRLAGADRRRLLGIVGIEAAIVLATALVLAAGVGGLTLAPMLHTQLHTWLPYLPPSYLLAGISMAVAVVATGMVASAVAFTRRRAIEVVSAVE